MKKFLLAAICLSVLATYTPVRASAASAGGVERIQEILKLLNENFLHGVNEDDMVNAAIRGMMNQLEDPYTDYFLPEEADDFMDQLNGMYVRIGIQYDLTGPAVVITDVLPGSPAETAGLKKGDKVTTVGGEAVTSETFTLIFAKYIPKEAGHPVTLGVNRDGKDMTFSVDFAVYENPQVYADMFDNKIGYLLLSGFNERAVTEFDAGLADLRQKGMKSLILDLRDNGGGEVQAALDIASRFIKEGNFVTFRDKNGLETDEAITGGSEIGVPVVILVNYSTASASEMLAGALQDYGVAKVVGYPTYGKGVMQQIASFEDGAFLKVTTHEYFTAKHHKVNNVGIQPDVQVDEDIAQVFKALELSGAPKLAVNVGSETFTLNGIEFTGSVPVIHKDGKTYVLAKLLAAMTDGKTEWQGGKTPGVKVIRAGVAQTFKMADKAIATREGNSYIDIARFKTAFPGFSWDETGGQLTLHYLFAAPLAVAN
jgi:carboxyl-terminal processing protease